MIIFSKSLAVLVNILGLTYRKLQVALCDATWYLAVLLNSVGSKTLRLCRHIGAQGGPTLFTDNINLLKVILGMLYRRGNSFACQHCTRKTLRGSPPSKN